MGTFREKLEGKALWCFVPFIILQIGLGAFKVYIGIDNLHSCQLQETIPVLLLISAILPLVFGTLVAMTTLNAADDKGRQLQMYSCCFFGLYLPVLFVVTVHIGSTFSKVTSNSFVLCENVITPDCFYHTCDITFLTSAVLAITFDWIFTATWFLAVCYIFVYR